MNPENDKLKVSKAIPASSGDSTILSVASGSRFVVTYLHLVANGSGDTITIKSGSTTIAGPFVLAANQPLQFEAGGAIVLKGTSEGDDFVVNQSSGNAGGTAMLMEMTE